MKKIFQIVGLISLVCFSFFVTEKTATVVNNMDEIMIRIKTEKDEYKLENKNAMIEGNTIIPGISSRKVNINKSYKNMKNNGYYDENLYVYDYTLPDISLADNLDKYIIKGNPSKRMVSLIFMVSSDNDINEILTIINNYNIKATFFVDTTWFTGNNNLIEEMIKKGHNVNIFMNNYTDPDFDWIDMVLKKINKQKNGFCYGLEDNDDNINSCKVKGNYTIRPTVISENTPLQDIKTKLESGALLSLKVNQRVKKELSTIIIYIKSKGYKITNLEEHILE